MKTTKALRPEHVLVQATPLWIAAAGLNPWSLESNELQPLVVKQHSQENHFHTNKTTVCSGGWDTWRCTLVPMVVPRWDVHTRSCSAACAASWNVHVWMTSGTQLCTESGRKRAVSVHMLRSMHRFLQEWEFVDTERRVRKQRYTEGTRGHDELNAHLLSWRISLLQAAVHFLTELPPCLHSTSFWTHNYYHCIYQNILSFRANFEPDPWFEPRSIYSSHVIKSGGLIVPDSPKIHFFQLIDWAMASLNVCIFF